MIVDVRLLHLTQGPRPRRLAPVVGLVLCGARHRHAVGSNNQRVLAVFAPIDVDGRRRALLVLKAPVRVRREVVADDCVCAGTRDMVRQTKK